MKTILLIILSVTMCSVRLLADEVYNGNIVLNGNKSIEANNIRIENFNITYSKVGSSSLDTITVDEVEKLTVVAGNYKIHGLLIGGLTGFMTYHIFTPSESMDSKNMVYFSVVGMVLGGVIGEFTYDTMDIELYKNLSMNFDFDIKQMPLTDLSNHQLVSLSLKF